MEASLVRFKLEKHLNELSSFLAYRSVRVGPFINFFLYLTKYKGKIYYENGTMIYAISERMAEYSHTPTGRGTLGRIHQ